MPCVEDWLTNPISVAEGILKEDGKPEHEKVRDFFSSRLQEPEALRRVPSLNDIPGHLLKPNSLVRFRCMVQDMFDPEFYFAVYETVQKANNSSQLRSGMYKDMVDCPEGWKLNLDSPNNVTKERYTFYCVPIPGETGWAKERFSKENGVSTAKSEAVGVSRAKRGLDTEEEMDQGTEINQPSLEIDVTNSDLSESKRARPAVTASSDEASSSQVGLDLNFPLPNEHGPACLVHVYVECNTFKVNDMVEFIGVLSVDPGLATFDDQTLYQDEEQKPVIPTQLVTIEEQAVHYPPPSLVPRIHCLVYYHLSHSNPCIPPVLQEESNSNILAQLSDTRGDLVSILSQVMYGDALAAEYMLLHLISSVYNWSGIMPLGKFALNLSGCLPSQSITQELYKLVEQLVPKCYFLSMTLDKMNTLNFIPTKDYSANRLKSSILQLTDGTDFIVDETALEAGQLNVNGVQNVAALGNIISWQKLEYDFNYYKAEFSTNLLLLILSEGKSLLPADCHVVLKHLKPAQATSSVLRGVSLEIMERMRGYLGVARLASYSLSSEMQQILQDDFVKSRQEDHTNMTAEDFHLLLLLARLMALSQGQTTLTEETWCHVKQMEMERRARLA